MTNDTYKDREREFLALYERAVDALSDVFPLLGDDDLRSRRAVIRGIDAARTAREAAERCLADLLRLRGDDDDAR